MGVSSLNLTFQVTFGLLLVFYNSLYKALTYLYYSLETSDVEVRQYSLAYWLFPAITFECSTVTKSPFLKSSQCDTEPVGITFWPPFCT